MDAVHVGDDHVLAQARPVDEIVDPGAERLDPFEPRRRLQNVVGEHGREGQKRVGCGDMGSDLGMMIDQIDVEFGEARPHPVAILVADRLGHCQ